MVVSTCYNGMHHGNISCYHLVSLSPSSSFPMAGCLPARPACPHELFICGGLYNNLLLAMAAAGREKRVQKFLGPPAAFRVLLSIKASILSSSPLLLVLVNPSLLKASWNQSSVIIHEDLLRSSTVSKQPRNVCKFGLRSELFLN